MKNDDHEVAVNRDKFLDRKVLRVQKAIESWAEKNRLWSDCGFFDYTDRPQPVEWDPSGVCDSAGRGWTNFKDMSYVENTQNF